MPVAADFWFDPVCPTDGLGISRTVPDAVHWLSESDVRALAGSAEPEDLVDLRRDTVLIRLPSLPHFRLIRAATVALVAAGLLAAFLVRAASHHAPSTLPAAAVGLSFRSPLVPTMATACAHDTCTSTTASDAELASLREFLGSTYIVDGDRIRDPHGVLQAATAIVWDTFGDHVQLRAVRTATAPSQWLGHTCLDGTMMVSRTILQTPQALWLVESRAVSEQCGRVTTFLWVLAETGAGAAQLDL